MSIQFSTKNVNKNFLDGQVFARISPYETEEEMKNTKM